MTTTLDRRAFLHRGALAGAGLMFAGPLQAMAARSGRGRPPRGEGYGPLVDKGELALPEGFECRVVSREGDPMSDGNPTPGIFDGMAAFPGPRRTTILIRNHENRRRPGEVTVKVPDRLRYDSDPSYNAGDTKLVLRDDREVIDSFAILGGTSTNCAGGQTPWGTWVASEEVFDAGAKPHGYNFEIDAYARGPVLAEPIRGAGRFAHEAVVWFAGALYQTEDQSNNAALYRFVPHRRPRRAGDLAHSKGVLQALMVVGHPNVNTRVGFPVGQPVRVDWVTLTEPEPAANTLRLEAASMGAAAFDRIEGCWVGNGRVYFDCTSAGAAGQGQIWELDVLARRLTLIYESPGAEQLKGPDNLVVAPTGDLFLCEDSEAPQHIRGLTPDGEIYDFARSIANPTEFAGACFSPDGRTLFVNQQGDRGTDPAVTYAIRGPWRRRRDPGHDGGGMYDLAAA